MKRQKGFFCYVVYRMLGKAILVSLLILLTNVTAQAQHEADNWIFGNQGGLNFSTGSPVAFSGALPAITAFEGSSVMSDQNGNLLFYTNGEKVWDKNNAVMTNGTGLLGSTSATQAALIVPWPGTQCKKFYVFTVNAQEDNLPDTLYYSIVDMTTNTLGVVTNKNTPLHTLVSEKLTAVKDAAGTGFWFIAHGFKQPDPLDPNPSVNKEYYVYHVDASGLNTSASTYLGSAHQNSAINRVPSMGQMKISPNRTLIASAANTAFVEILNFDSVTGAITGPPKIFSASNSPFQAHSVYAFYGIEFSPNSGFLYVSILGPTSKLFQLDFSNSTATLLSTGAAAGYDIGQLQLGPDNKVYVARYSQTYISVISSPSNACGSTSTNACNFTAIGATLPSGATSQLGLPTIIEGYSCAPPPQACCDKLAAVPYTQQNLDIDYRTFTITNLKAPVSPICSVDIVFNPPPPFVVGGGLYIDGSLIPTGTRFVSPYNRIPNAGAATISAVNTVQFNLGVDYTLIPPWVGTVTFTVNHCDGSKCTLNYGPWTARPPRPPGDPINFYDSTLRLEGNLHALSFQLKRQDRSTPISWISFMVADGKGQLFAGSGSPASEERERAAPIAVVEDTPVPRGSVLYRFLGPLRSGEASGTFDLVLKRDANATGAPVIIWTTYDPNGNALERGTITSRRGAPQRASLGKMASPAQAAAK
jgi:hypothetical protein